MDRVDDRMDRVDDRMNRWIDGWTDGRLRGGTEIAAGRKRLLSKVKTA